MIKNKSIDDNYIRLQKQYKNVPALKKSRVNEIIDLYKTRRIYNIITAKNLINNVLTSNNTQAENLHYYKTMVNYMSKTPSNQKKQQQKINKNFETRNNQFNELFKTNKKRDIIKSIEEINSDKAFSIIKINLNTNPAFPKMPPDRPGKGSFEIPFNFENGLPHEDVRFENFKNSLIRPITKIIKKLLKEKLAIKIQLDLIVLCYRLTVDDMSLKYHYDTLPTSTNIKDITISDVDEIVDTLLLDLENKIDHPFSDNGLQGSGWKIKQIKTLSIKVYKIKPPRGSSYIPTPAPYNTSRLSLIHI